MSYTITDACNGCQACTKLCPVNAISGEKKVMHIIDSSVCIDCGACGRICPQNAVLDQLKRACSMVKRSLWEKPQVSIQLCMSCNICIETCPVNCLALSQPHDSGNPHGHPYLKEAKACIGCGYCALECPVEAIVMASPVVEAAG